MQGNQRNRFGFQPHVGVGINFKGLSDQAVPKHLREYLKSLGFERVSEAADQQLLLAAKQMNQKCFPYHQHKVRRQSDYQNPQQRRIWQQNQHRQRQQEERKRASIVRKSSQRRR